MLGVIGREEFFAHAFVGNFVAGGDDLGGIRSEYVDHAFGPIVPGGAHQGSHGIIGRLVRLLCVGGGHRRKDDSCGGPAG